MILENKFKIRASAAHTILGGTMGITDIQAAKLEVLESKKRTEKQQEEYEKLIEKRDNKELPQGAKTVCDNWILEQVYGRRKEFSNKFTTKGNTVELDSIYFMRDLLFYPEAEKNEDYFEDEYMNGTPDVILPDLIIDVKNSWSFDTFPLLEESIPTPAYETQLQVYMHLTGREKARLVYTLMDTPQFLIDRECNYYCSNTGYKFEDLIDQFTEKNTYSNVDSMYRIKTYDVNYDESVIDLIKERVLLCREYINCKVKDL